MLPLERALDYGVVQCAPLDLHLGSRFLLTVRCAETTDSPMDSNFELSTFVS